MTLVVLVVLVVFSMTLVVLVVFMTLVNSCQRRGMGGATIQVVVPGGTPQGGGSEGQWSSGSGSGVGHSGGQGGVQRGTVEDR